MTNFWRAIFLWNYSRRSFGERKVWLVVIPQENSRDAETQRRRDGTGG